MKSNTLFQSLLALRDQFLGSSANQTAAVANLFAGRPQQVTVVAASGDVVSFNTNATDSLITVSRQNEQGVVTTEAVTIPTITIEAPNFDPSQILINEDDGTTLATVLSDISNGAALNETVSEMTSSFLGSASLSIADAAAVIDRNGQMLHSDAQSLKQQMFSMAADGKISNYAWLTLLRSWLQDSKDAADQGSIIMDQTKPRIIQSISSTIFETLFQTFGTMLLTFGNLVVKVMGVIVMAVGSLVSYVSQLVTDLDVNYWSSTYYLNGPVCFLTGYNNNTPQDVPVDASSVVLRRLGNIDLFMWHTNSLDEQSPWNYNGFLNVNLDLDKALKKVCDVFTFADYTPTSVTVRANQVSQLMTVMKEICTSDEYQLDYTDISRIISDKRKLANYYAYSIVLSLCMSLCYDGRLQQAPSFTAELYPSEAMPQLPTTTAAMLKNAIAVVEHLAYHRFVDSSYSWSYENQPADKSIKFIQNYYTVYLNPINGSDAIMTNSGDQYFDLPSSQQWRFGSSVIASLYATVYATMGDIYAVTNYVPTDRLASIPEIAQSTIVRDLIIAAALASAVAITSVVVARKLQARRILKQSSAIERLNDARKLYAADPTVANGDTFVRQVRAYNLKAKIFGWGSYDFANGWANSSGDAPTTMSSGFVESLIDSAKNSHYQVEKTVESKDDVMAAIQKVQTSIAPV